MSTHNICFYGEPRRGASNEYPQHMFLWRTGENYPRIIIKYSSLTSPLLLFQTDFSQTVVCIIILSVKLIRIRVLILSV